MITLKDVGYEVEAHRVFEDVSFSISGGDKVGFVGPNGAGKTTLLRMISGELEPTEGRIITEEVEVGLLPQDLREWRDQSVYGFIEEVTGVKAVKDFFTDAESKYLNRPDDESALEAYCTAAEKLGHYDIDDFDGRVEKALKKAGLQPDFAELTIGGLSGGQRTRVALAAIMASRYDVVLLDEPTNNLDMQGIGILERFIRSSNAAFLMVSHDRRFLRNTTSRIIELLCDGINSYGLGYDEYVEARAKAYENEVKRYDEHKVAVKALAASVREKKQNASSADSGGSKRTDNDKLGANHRAGRASGHLASQARNLESRLERLKEDEPRKPQKPISLDFMFSAEDISSQQLLGIDGVRLSYLGDKKSFGPYELHIGGGEKIAVTGPNGSGKSTLVKAIVGDENVSVADGSIRVSPNARVAYIDQNQTLPIPTGTPLENLMALSQETSKEDATHLLRKFNFSRTVFDSVRAQNLSGGERAKVLLAAVAARKANLLILDEPTNNLDIPTIEGLQEALKTYQGAIVMISHDRDFIDGIGVTRTIEIA